MTDARDQLAAEADDLWPRASLTACARVTAILRADVLAQGRMVTSLPEDAPEAWDRVPNAERAA